MPVVNLARLAAEPLAPARLLELQFAYLAGLDRPTIFLCKNDKTATWWRDAAAMRGIGIPDPLGIIGVGDNPVLTEDRSLDLTSVLLPDRHLGLLAARHLHRLLCGDPAPEGETVVAPLRVVERATTRLHRPRSPAVAQAIAAMRHHLARPLDQRALAAAVGCSHWQLWRAFTREVGCAPKAYQVRLRLARAEELLRTTDLPPAEVAARCGYASARTLRLPFARRYGRAPRAYRRLAGGASRTGGRDLDRAPRGSPGP
jgi:LacI family transcriptional regulator